MDILAAIRREQRKVERQLGKLQKQMDGLTAAAKALGDSAMDRVSKTQERVMSPAIKAKISASAKKRWAKIKAGARKSAG